MQTTTKECAPLADVERLGCWPSAYVLPGCGGGSEMTDPAMGIIMSGRWEEHLGY